MRPYRSATPAERDARRERRLIRASDEAASAIPPARHEDLRQPFDWTFSCGGVSWALHFERNPRDVRQWRVFRDGQPRMRAGLDWVWRALQREMSPALGRRHWR
jgi:hypothetical protein